MAFSHRKLVAADKTRNSLRGSYLLDSGAGSDPPRPPHSGSDRDWKMKTLLWFASLVLLTGTMAAAQTASQSHFATASGNHNSATSSQSAPAQSNSLRGCLSGSKGNYILTDHQGKQYKVVGDNHALWDDAGHEVDLSGAAKSSDSFQESAITDIASRCWNFRLN